MDILQAIEERHSVRKFEDGVIPEDVVTDLRREVEKKVPEKTVRYGYNINITSVPAFVYHGELVYQAKGTETEEDWESIIKNLMSMADPKVVGAH